MKTTINAETLKNSGNLHAIFNVADLQIVDDYWINTTIYELIGNFDKLTVKSYVIDDDFNVNFEAENEPIKAEIFSHGSIVISPEMTKFIISSNGETVEIFQDRNQIVFYIDGKSRYFFDADFLDDIENKRIEKEEQEKADREEYEREQEEKWGSVPKLESSASIIANFGTIYKGVSHMITRGSRAVIEKGVLYIEGNNGVSIRDLNEPRITTDNIINFVKSWKDCKINGVLTQFEDGTGSFNSVNRGDLYRPIRYFNQCANRLDPCYTTGLNVFYPSNLPQILSRFKADERVIIADKTESVKLVFRVGTLKKSFSHFKTARLTMCTMGRKPYLVVIDDYNLSDMDIIFPLSVDPVDLPVFRFDFKVNNMNKETESESAKKAPKIDASKQAATNTTPTGKAPEKQAEEQETAKEETTEKPEQEKAEKLETEKRVKIATVESSAPLASVPEPENRSAAADQNGPAAAAEPEPMEEKPERSGAEKPFEIGTYTTKKGKIKTSIRFFQPPTPAQIEALKKAYFWEYAGTWNGSPRKLPEIFKH